MMTGKVLLELLSFAVAVVEALRCLCLVIARGTGSVHAELSCKYST